MRRPNPLLQFGNKRRDPLVARPKTLVITVVLLATSAIGVWYLIWSPTFRIKDIEVRGASVDTEQAIRGVLDRHLATASLFILPRSNVFVFNKSSATKDIEKDLYLERLVLTTKIPGRLTVEVAERSLRAVLLTSDRFLALDESGIVLRELSSREIEALGDLPPNVGSASVPELGAESMDTRPTETASDKKPAAAVVPTQKNVNKFPLIIDQTIIDQPQSTRQERRPGENAVSSAAMTLILQANARLPDLSGTRVRWFGVRDGAETVEATMEGGWLAYLTTLIPFDVQGSRLSLVLKEKIGVKKNDLEYVDLRYNERIFFRYKNAAGTK
jgi:cell division septal protein FtsQ